MWAVTGYSTTIVQYLRKITGAPFYRIGYVSDGRRLADPGCRFDLPPQCRYFVLAAGVLTGKRIDEQTPEEVADCLNVNAVNVVRLCEHILATVEDARICVVGSESAWKGSYDQAYAMSKAAVHAYVKTRCVLTRDQQLVAVAPPIITDSGMTERRPDYAKLMRSNRKMTTALNVAQAIRSLVQDTNKQNEVVSL